MNTYKELSKQVFTQEGFKLVPIRHGDRYDIMKWRNEQIYHLRQSKPLTKEKQDWYFENVVNKLFVQEKPDQILFSFLKDDICIGYGGLVHINWLDRNAEISFIMDTELEESNFFDLWTVYIGLIEQVAFENLTFHKLYVYAFDIRADLYEVLEINSYFLDARLKEHTFYEGQPIDVVIYSKINPSS